MKTSKHINFFFVIQINLLTSPTNTDLNKTYIYFNKFHVVGLVTLEVFIAV